MTFSHLLRPFDAIPINSPLVPAAFGSAVSWLGDAPRTKGGVILSEQDIPHTKKTHNNRTLLCFSDKTVLLAQDNLLYPAPFILEEGAQNPKALSDSFEALFPVACEAEFDNPQPGHMMPAYKPGFVSNNPYEMDLLKDIATTLLYVVGQHHLKSHHLILVWKTQPLDAWGHLDVPKPDLRLDLTGTSQNDLTSLRRLEKLAQDICQDIQHMIPKTPGHHLRDGQAKPTSFLSVKGPRAVSSHEKLQCQKLPFLMELKQSMAHCLS
jgi:hypothetical protein